MKQKTSSKKLRLLLFIGIPVLIILVAAIIALSGVNTFLKPVIKSTLEKIVVNGSDSLYTFSINDYNIGPGGKSVTINGLDIHVDSSRYKLLKTAGLLPKLIFSVQVKNAAVSGLQPWEIWKHKNIICNGVTLNGAKVNILEQEKRNDTIPVNDSSKTLYELIKPDINNINIRRISILNADVTFKTVQQQTLQNDSWHFENSNVMLDDIIVDATVKNDTSRVLYAANLQVSLGSFSMISSDGIYRFSTKNTDYDFRKRTATIKDFKILPAISKAEFNKRLGHEADLLTVSIKTIDIDAFNAGALLADNSVEAGFVKLDAPDISLYKDKNAGPDNSSKMGKYPHQLLLKASIPIRIKKIAIDDGKLLVTQKSIKTKEEGSFRFHDVKGAIENITNHTEDITANKWCKANLSANFMGSNPMHAIFNFDLAATNGHFTTDATLASLSPQDINPTFRALAAAELETFKLDKLAYHAEGNDNDAVGNLDLKYHDLKLNVLKKDADGNMQKKGLISLLANLIKLYDDNPMPGKEERRAINIREERLPNKNFFGLVVKTLLKCTQEIAVKGDNKELPGMGGTKKPEENKKQKKFLGIFKKK